MGTVGLIGEFHHTIDAKGRLSVPSKFRTVLGDRFVITKGFDKCLTIYSVEDWEAFQDNMAKLNNLDPAVRELKRFFGSAASEVVIDPHGRVLIPANLQGYAGLTKDVTIVGTTDGKAEIWDSAAWEEKQGGMDPLAAAQSLLNSGIML